MPLTRFTFVQLPTVESMEEHEYVAQQTFFYFSLTLGNNSWTNLIRLDDRQIFCRILELRAPLTESDVCIVDLSSTRVTYMEYTAKRT